MSSSTTEVPFPSSSVNSREFCKVVALESVIKLQERSILFNALFYIRSSANDSQNFSPSEFPESESSSREVLFVIKSLHNLAPPLSSILLSFNIKAFRVLLTFKACARYLEPS